MVNKIGMYLKLSTDITLEEDSTFIKLVESFHKAWKLVNSFLPNYGKQLLCSVAYAYVVICAYIGRRRVPKELLIKMPDTPQSIPLAYLIPTTTGKGICSTALVDFLVSTHNDFIEFYHGIIKIK